MREIKFRCYYDHHMHKVKSIDFDYEEINLEAADIISFKDGNLMQYTGLKDKNGVEIYEGDIIKFTANRWNNSMIYPIVYNTGRAKFVINAPFKKFGINNGNVEVIGNIYENKELLEQ